MAQGGVRRIGAFIQRGRPGEMRMGQSSVSVTPMTSWYDDHDGASPVPNPSAAVSLFRQRASARAVQNEADRPLRPPLRPLCQPVRHQGVVLRGGRRLPCVLKAFKGERLVGDDPHRLQIAALWRPKNVHADLPWRE